MAVGDDALAAAGAGREQVELRVLAPDQPAEQEATGVAQHYNASACAAEKRRHLSDAPRQRSIST